MRVDITKAPHSANYVPLHWPDVEFEIAYGRRVKHRSVLRTRIHPKHLSHALRLQ